LSLFNDFFRKMHDRVTARFYPGSRLILGLENTVKDSPLKISNELKANDRCLPFCHMDHSKLRSAVPQS
jgi:hypothetical protein